MIFTKKPSWTKKLMEEIFMEEFKPVALENSVLKIDRIPLLKLVSSVHQDSNPRNKINDCSP